VQEPEPTEVYYDGSCGLCNAACRWAQKRDVHGSLAFRDAMDPLVTERLGPERERLVREMLVRAPKGQLAGGFAGWLAVLRVLPRWRVLAAALALPPVRWLGPPLYRLVARHRHLFHPS
jgi:predicted DCC family thiol-disulfide oxidoreductase YuxK